MDTRFRPAVRAALLPSALGVAAVTLLMLLTPFSQAAPVHPAVAYAAPFLGKIASGTSLQSVDCAVSGTITKAPTFNRTSGVEQISEKSSARSCPSALGYGYEITAGNAGLWTPSFHGISGLYHVVAKWRVTWSEKLVANIGPLFTGSAHASSYLVGILYLYDGSNLTYLPATAGWSNFTVSNNGTLSLHASALVTLYLNQTVILGHTYSILTWIDASTESYASSNGPSSASAGLNLGTAGYGAKLLSITRS